MIWQSWNDFFAMGGYALYVWGSLGVTFALMALETLALRARTRELRARLRKMVAHGARKGRTQ
ncbi:MAG: heme exporter protein CcmD [Telluria sp.]|jgi:heme exporter protein D|nr:heme exporter protein CcmD [Telluria sp.]